jgi:hypothetical protein
MVRDFHTKPLQGETFRSFQDAIIVHNLDKIKPNPHLKKEKKWLERVVFDAPVSA